MTPDVAKARRLPMVATFTLQHAAALSRDAAELVAEEYAGSSAAERYLLIADRISDILEGPNPSRSRLLAASPRVVELSGRTRTLIEMVESDPGDDDYRVRIAKLLLRALNWNPDSLPHRSV